MKGKSGKGKCKTLLYKTPLKVLLSEMSEMGLVIQEDIVKKRRNQIVVY